MASLRKFPKSDFFFACFTGPDGRRRQVSTKQVDRRKAQRMADEWAQAAKSASLGRLGDAQARRVLSDIHETINGEPLNFATVQDYLTGWLERREPDPHPHRKGL